MKALFVATAVATFIATTTVTYIIGKKGGKKTAVNNLRNEQLAQSEEEYQARKDLPFKGTLAELSQRASEIEEWYAAETVEINEMYDEILNK